MLKTNLMVNLMTKAENQPAGVWHNCIIGSASYITHSGCWQTYVEQNSITKAEDQLAGEWHNWTTGAAFHTNHTGCWRTYAVQDRLNALVHGE